MNQHAHLVSQSRDADTTVPWLGCFGALMLWPLRALLRGYVLSTLWAWFLVPVFGVPRLTVAPAIGLSIIAGFLTHQLQRQVEPPTLKSISEQMMQTIISPIVVLGFGWTVTWFM